MSEVALWCLSCCPESCCFGKFLACVNHFLLLCSSFFSVKGYATVKVCLSFSVAGISLSAFPLKNLFADGVHAMLSHLL